MVGVFVRVGRAAAERQAFLVASQMSLICFFFLLTASPPFVLLLLIHGVTPPHEDTQEHLCGVTCARLARTKPHLNPKPQKPPLTRIPLSMHATPEQVQKNMADNKSALEKQDPEHVCAHVKRPERNIVHVK